MSEIDFEVVERTYHQASQGNVVPQATFIVADSVKEAQQKLEELIEFVEEKMDERDTATT